MKRLVLTMAALTALGTFTTQSAMASGRHHGSSFGHAVGHLVYRGYGRTDHGGFYGRGSYGRSYGHGFGHRYGRGYRHHGRH